MKVNRTRIGDILGVTLRTVDRWVIEGMPATKNGKLWEFETKEVIAWVVDRDSKKSEDDDAEKLKLRKLKAETELAEIKAMTEAGLLVPLSESERQWTSSVLEFKSYILQLPSRISSQLLGVTDESEIKEILVDGINESLEIFSNTEFECEEEEVEE